MDPQQLWILVGICLGSGAGLMGACAGWLRWTGRLTRRLRVIIAVLTLLFALGLAVVALGVNATRGTRLLLLLPALALGYWFVRQVSCIRAANRSGPDTGRGDCKG